MKLYPLLFQPNLHTVVWGGNRLCPYKGLPASTQSIGESWEVSAVPSSKSIVANGEWAGQDLVSVIAQAPEDILGNPVYDKYHELPLLAKFIDAEPGSYLYAGFKTQITDYEFKKRIEDGTITDVLARHEVKAGDVFYLPAGRVHAICSGILLAEIQQSSDLTYRIFDYNRPGLDGKPRQLHVDLAAEAVDFHVEAEYQTAYQSEENRANPVLDTPYFSVRVNDIAQPFHRNLLKYDSFIITMSIKGDTRILVRSTGDELLLKEGNSCLIPAAIADYDLIPLSSKSLVLDAFIDNKDRSLGHRITRFLHLTSK